MYLRIMSLLLITLIFSQCKKAGNGSPSGSSVQKVQREHGQPAGPLVQQTIGANGGTITSDDGGLVLNIPAGAVEAATNFSIQRVENMLESKGAAYRLLPETIFKKPITLTMSYAAAGIRPEESKYLFPVYQDAAGYYFQPNHVQHDAAAKTLTVQTTHFSDWSFSTRVELRANGHVNGGVAELHGGESVSLNLVKYLTDDKTPDAYQDGVPLMEDLLFADVAKISWTKTSNTGSLQSQKANAKYTAPASVSQEESLLVTATVEDDNLGKDNTGQVIRQMILSQPVTLLPDDENYFELTEDGTTYRIKNPRFSLAGGFLRVIGDFPGRSIEISVKGATGAGAYTFGELGLEGKAGIVYTVSNTSIFVHFRTDDCGQPKDIHYSPGALNISRVAGNVGEYTEGNFSGEVYAYDWCPSHQQKTVSGKFKIRKDY